MTEEKKITSTSMEVAITAASALVGFAIGGPVGAVIGGSTTSAIKLTQQIVQQWTERRKARLTKVLENSFEKSKISDEEILEKLANDTLLADDIIGLLRQLIDTDPELDCFFSFIINAMITGSDDNERKRLKVLSNSIKGLNSVQMQIIKIIADNNNVLSAADISTNMGIPEIELRNSVRDLELRGIITDNNSEPTIWELRELGIAIAEIIISMEDKKNEI